MFNRPNSTTNTQILILATDGYEKSELEYPLEKLKQAGVHVKIGSLKHGSIRSWDNGNWGDSVKVDLVIDEIEVSDFQAIVLPGGQMNPDILRADESVIKLIKKFAADGKTVAAVCHAPWLLAEAGLLKGRTVTSYKSMKTDIVNAGAIWIDNSVVVDKNFITSREPDDLPDFVGAILENLQRIKIAA